MRFRLELTDGEEEIVARVHAPSPLTERIEAMVHQTHLTVYQEETDSVAALPFERIESVSVQEGRTIVTDVDGNVYTSRLKLYEAEERLPDDFLRISRSALANRQQIERFTAVFSGTVNVIFRSGRQEFVSRRCFADLKRRFLK